MWFIVLLILGLQAKQTNCRATSRDVARYGQIARYRATISVLRLQTQNDQNYNSHILAGFLSGSASSQMRMSNTKENYVKVLYL